MNTPVSFEIAKLLKEKGFDEQSLTIYQDGEILFLKSTISNSQFLTSRNYTAPTISDVVMWLFEKHGIWIACETSKLGKFNYRLSKKESSKLITLPFTFEVVNAGYDYNSPTEAYEAAIEYCLNQI